MTVKQTDNQALDLGDCENQPVVLPRSLEQMISAGDFISLCEIHSPVPEKRDVFVRDADLLKPYFDAMVVTGQIKGRSVLSSSVAAGILRDRNIESVAVLCGQECDEGILPKKLRDISRGGIRSAVCLSGDPIANKQGAIDGLEMLRVAGHSDALCDRVYFGGVIDPFLQPVDHAVRRLGQKVNAGADFVLTQMIFDLSGFKTFCDAIRVAGLDQKTAVIAGIAVVVSEQGLALAKRLPGVCLPMEVQKQLLGASDMSACGMAMAKRLIGQVRQLPSVRGVCLMLLGGRDYQQLIDVIHN
ncbi:methylenetetrahydrofolate reductase [bacterium AH-315-I18]|nr:methylenetetrahydrofolate reductase [Phycisphaeraceae bacterium]MBN4060912.1 methylenetetrahydrofolate reductase [bacterium AH-315-I18]